MLLPAQGWCMVSSAILVYLPRLRYNQGQEQQLLRFEGTLENTNQNFESFLRPSVGIFFRLFWLLERTHVVQKGQFCLNYICIFIHQHISNFG